MTTDRTKAERALAFLVAQLRTEWAEPGILAALRKVSEQPLADVAAAALDCAAHRSDQRSPAIIAMDGRHWTALDRMAGQADTPSPPTQSVIVTYCAHGEPGSSCPECFPRTHHGALPTAEQRAAMRQAIADAKTEAHAPDARPALAGAVGAQGVPALRNAPQPARPSQAVFPGTDKKE